MLHSNRNRGLAVAAVLAVVISSFLLASGRTSGTYVTPDRTSARTISDSSDPLTQSERASAQRSSPEGDSESSGILRRSLIGLEARDPDDAHRGDVRVSVTVGGCAGLPLPDTLSNIDLLFEFDDRVESLSLAPGTQGSFEIDQPSTCRVTLSGANFVYRQLAASLEPGGMLDFEAELSASFVGRFDCGGADVPTTVGYRYDFTGALSDDGDLVYESSGRKLTLAEDGRFLLVGEQGAGAYLFYLDELELEGAGMELGGFVAEGSQVDLGAWTLRQSGERRVEVIAQVMGSPPPEGSTVDVTALSASPTGLARFGGEIDVPATRDVRKMSQATRIALDRAGAGEALLTDAPYYLAVGSAPGLPPVHSVVARDTLAAGPIPVEFAPGREVQFELLTDDWARDGMSNVRVEIRGAGLPTQVPLDITESLPAASVVLPAAASAELVCVADWRGEDGVRHSVRLVERTVAIDTASDLPQVVQLDLRVGPSEESMTIPVRLPGTEFESGLAAVHMYGGAGGLRRIPVIEGTVTIPLGTGPTSVALYGAAEGHSRVAHTYFSVEEAIQAPEPMADMSGLSISGAVDPTVGTGYVYVMPAEHVRGIPRKHRGVTCSPKDDGTFEVYGLVPGRYVVGIEGSDHSVELEIERAKVSRVRLPLR